MLLSLNEATDDLVCGVELSKAAGALICGRTLAILRVRVVVHALAATCKQSLRPHFGFRLERVVPLERNVGLVVPFVPNLPPCVVAVQVLPVAVGRRLHPSQSFLRQLTQWSD